jgi:hypothetical protein
VDQRPRVLPVARVAEPLDPPAPARPSAPDDVQAEGALDRLAIWLAEVSAEAALAGNGSA